jgi:2'-5' RNA ligase
VDTFISGEVLWPHGWTKLHVYVLLDLAEIKDLVDVYQCVIEEFSFIAAVPDEWLHATVQMIGGVAARDVSPEQRAELEIGLRQRISGLASFEMMVGGAIATSSGVVLDLTPDDEFVEMTYRTQEVICDVLGHGAVAYSSARPHITLGYASAHGDSGAVASKLRRATDQRATVTVAKVSLVDVIQDRERHQYRWTRLADISLEHDDTQAVTVGPPRGLRAVPDAAEFVR